MERNWLVVIVLLAAVAFSGWLRSILDPQIQVAGEGAATDPGSYMENFTRSAMDVAGNLATRLSADKMYHYPHSQSTELLSPVLEVHNGGDLPWHITSERGWVDSEEEVILLFGPVHGWKEGSNGEPELEIRTTDLRILAKNEYAETNRPVTLIGPGTITHGVGMQASLGRSKVKLLEKVRTLYDRKADQ